MSERPHARVEGVLMAYADAVVAWKQLLAGEPIQIEPTEAHVEGEIVYRLTSAAASGRLLELSSEAFELAPWQKEFLARALKPGT